MTGLRLILSASAASSGATAEAYPTVGKTIKLADVFLIRCEVYISNKIKWFSLGAVWSLYSLLQIILTYSIFNFCWGDIILNFLMLFIWVACIFAGFSQSVPAYYMLLPAAILAFLINSYPRRLNAAAAYESGGVIRFFLLYVPIQVALMMTITCFCFFIGYALSLIFWVGFLWSIELLRTSCKKVY